MSEVIKKSREAIELFESKLKTAAQSLSQENRVDVEKLKQLDGYNLNHPRGIYGILFNGDEYKKREDVKGGVLVMQRNILIGVVSFIRFFDNPGVENENVLMLPSEYTELAVDELSGIEIESSRPQYDSKIYSSTTTLVDVEDNKWKYLTTFHVPVDWIEKQYRN